MVRFVAVLVAAIAMGSCRPAVLTQLVEARRVAANLHLQFTKAVEASNRAVMAAKRRAAPPKKRGGPFGKSNVTSNSSIRW
jgi:hypothetical protein